MQQLSMYSQRFVENPIRCRIPINHISQYRISFIADMNSNLMHSSRMDFDFHQGNLSKQRVDKRLFQSAFGLGLQSFIIIYFNL